VAIVDSCVLFVGQFWRHLVAKGGQELEVKFYIRDLDRLKERLIVSGARTTQARMLETNLRFDTTGGDLSRAFKAPVQG
jgi:hypothetical protein